VRTLDTFQERAVNVEENAVVAAGAGSGKTTVLARRYVRMVTQKRVGVKSILTLTFTRKAAAEMYERIHRNLLAHADDPFVAEQLDLFDQAQISTVDSFCAQIARNDSTRYGVPPTFTVDENENRKLARDVALGFLLEHADSKVLQRYIAANGFIPVWQNGFAALAEQELLVARETDMSAMADRQFHMLRTHLIDELRRIEDAVMRLSSLDPGGGKTIRNLQDGLTSLDIPGLLRRANPGDADWREEAVRCVSACQNAKKTGIHRSNPDAELLKECIEEIRETAGAVGEILATLEAEGDARALLALVGAFQERVVKEKRLRGLLTYQDVMELAVRILKENRDLRRYYGERFRYVMIDEFQDNNTLQKELLYLLAADPAREADGPVTPDPSGLRADRLFFVGDDKQSIYRFRGADVSVFRRLSSELASAGGVEVPLSTNYRSEPALVEFFNILFHRVMSEPSADYEAEFAPLVTRPPTPDLTPTFHLLVKEESTRDEAMPDALHNNEAEAYHVSAIIRRMVDEKWRVREGNGTRAVRYDDIALLMRSTSNQIVFERMFRAFGIPYTSQSVRSLFLDAPVYDIYHLLQTAIFPEDRAAYAGLLRSPLVQLSDPGIVSVLKEDQAPFVAAPELTTEDSQRYETGAELFRQVAERIDVDPLPDILTDIWYRYGYRYNLLKRPSYHAYLEYFDYLYSLAVRTPVSSVSEFLDLIRENLGAYERLDDVELIREHASGVQIMTVHKSKGLEFPVVILANAGNKGQAGGLGSGLYYVSEEYGLTFNIPVEPRERKSVGRARINYFYSRGKEENDARDLAELKRLLYVAATRAECHFIVSGSFNRSNRRSSDTHLAMVLDALGWDREAKEIPGGEFPLPANFSLLSDINQHDVWEASQTVPHRDLENAVERYGDCDVSERTLTQAEYSATELNGLYRETASGASAASAVRELPAIGVDTLIQEQGREAYFGTLCHYLIEKAVESGEPRSFVADPGALPAPLTRGVEPESLLKLLSAAEALVFAFWESDTGKEILAAAADGAEVESEVPFVLLRRPPAGPLWIKGKIDLVVRYRDRVHIIDFKTDRQVEEEAYALQMKLYREASAALTGVPVRIDVVYLRGPVTVDYTQVDAPDPVELLSGAGLWGGQATG